MFNIKLITELVENSKTFTRNIKDSLYYIQRTSHATKKLWYKAMDEGKKV